jgi:hypothetical protein
MTLASGYSFDGQSAQPAVHHGSQNSCGDPMEAYFTCITTCSLDDGSCITQCVEEFREQQ